MSKQINYEAKIEKLRNKVWLNNARIVKYVNKQIEKLEKMKRKRK